MIKVQLTGNVGRTPEIRYGASGTPYCRLSVGVTKRQRQGEDKPGTDWVSVTCFKEVAEAVARDIHKGMSIYVEGTLESRKYLGKDGVESVYLDVAANKVEQRERVKGGAPGFGSHSTTSPPRAAPGGPPPSPRPNPPSAYSSTTPTESDLQMDELPF